MYAASAIAANTIARSACGSAAPLFTNQMFTALGVGGGGSLIGGVAALLAIIPFLFYKYGKQIRVKSRFAPAPDARAQEKSDEEAGPRNEDTQSPESQSSLSGSSISQFNESDEVERGERIEKTRD